MNDWIPVEKRLPLRGDSVLAYGYGAIIGPAARLVHEVVYTDKNGKPEWMVFGSDYDMKGVTHWRPLPSPPLNSRKGESD